MLVLIKQKEYQHLCFKGDIRSYDRIGEHTAKFRKASECWLMGVQKGASLEPAHLGFSLWQRAVVSAEQSICGRQAAPCTQ